MALPEHQQQELVVGLYDRGVDADPKRRILNIGSPQHLKSGIWSPYLVNFRPALSIDEKSAMPVATQKMVKGLLLEAVGIEIEEIAQSQEIGFFHIFGPPEAGTPLASAVSGASGQSLLWQRVIPKEGYGTHQSIEGVYFPDQAVIEVDDVVTTGETKAEAKEALEADGLVVVGAAVGFDREQGGMEAIREMGLEARAALSAIASFGFLHDAKRISTTEHDYLVEYTLTPPFKEAPASHPWE